MIKKQKLISALILNIFTVLSLCTAAQLLSIWRGSLSDFQFFRLALNFLVAYPVAVLARLAIPADKFGNTICRILQLKPGFLFELTMNISINLIMTIILSSVMSFFNMIILEHLPVDMLLLGIIQNFIPMWMVSCVVAAIFVKPVDSWVETRFGV